MDFSVSGSGLVWISVEDRLPPDGSGMVWVIVQHGDIQYLRRAWKIDKSRAKDYAGSPWIIDSDALFSFEHVHESMYITHWLPIVLPSFPRPIKDFEGYAVEKEEKNPRVILYK